MTDAWKNNLGETARVMANCWKHDLLDITFWVTANAWNSNVVYDERLKLQLVPTAGFPVRFATQKMFVPPASSSSTPFWDLPMAHTTGTSHWRPPVELSRPGFDLEKQLWPSVLTEDFATMISATDFVLRIRRGFLLQFCWSICNHDFRHGNRATILFMFWSSFGHVLQDQKT